VNAADKVQDDLFPESLSVVAEGRIPTSIANSIRGKTQILLHEAGRRI
jgi:hypothetical protein